MAQAFQLLSFGSPRPAAMADIEAELSALWRSAPEDAEGRKALTRACALTLLVCVDSEEAGREVSNFISLLTPQNPCRAIVIIAEPDAVPAELTAAVSAHCHLATPGEKQVCCEQITVTARGEAVENLDTGVLPLTVPGLPVCLWWRSNRFPPPRCFEHILRVANHILLDSGRFSSSEAALPALAAEVQRLGSEVVVTDLNWARIIPWRELTAQFFDSPETRPYLDWLREIRIEYHRAAPELPARRGRLLLYAGWLASRLGWEPVSHAGDPSSERRSFRFRSREGFVEVAWAPREYDGEGAAVSFSLVSQSASGTATFALASMLGRKSVVTRLELPGRLSVERIVHLAVPDEVELVNEELKYARRDRIYEEALAMIARMTA